MKRQIKFRAKRPDDGKWVFGDLKHHQKVTRTGLEPTILVDNDPVIQETIGQFTGLLDKNGNEVYEGDFIKAPSGRIYLIMWATWKHQEKRSRGIIDEYQFTGWCIGYKRDKPMDTLDSEVLQGEVIGNVFDNPELLEGGKG